MRIWFAVELAINKEHIIQPLHLFFFLLLTTLSIFFNCFLNRFSKILDYTTPQFECNTFFYSITMVKILSLGHRTKTFHSNHLTHLTPSKIYTSPLISCVWNKFQSFRKHFNVSPPVTGKLVKKILHKFATISTSRSFEIQLTSYLSLQTSPATKAAFGLVYLFYW